MPETLRWFLSEDHFMPHGMCYLWQPGVLWLNVVSDAAIALAYFSIPFALLYFVRKRTDLQFQWMFVLFAVFIVACGATHLMDVIVVWHPYYWIAGTVKAVTALASVPTAVMLVQLMPKALRLPSPARLAAANMELARQIAERERAEEQVRRINAGLETRIAARTGELEAANARLSSQLHQLELLQTIIDNTPAVVYAKYLDGRYLLANRRYEQIVALRREAILGHTDHDFFPAKAADAFRAMDARVAAAGHALTEEETAPHADGPHAYISVKAPLIDTDGRIYAIFGISTDITEFKRVEERLRHQLERLRLLDRITRAIGDHEDLHSIFQVVVRTLEDELPLDFGCVCLYESARQELEVAGVGAKSRALALELALPERARLDIDQNGLSRCVQGELVHEPDVSNSPYPFPARLAAGGLRSLVVAPLSVRQQVFGVLVAARREPHGFESTDCEFLRQLTEHLALASHQVQLYAALQRAYEDLRQTQEAVMQQERLRALGQMASGIAHDINNALSPAALYTEAILDRDQTLGAEARKYLTVVLRAIHDVGNTVARMREFYRPRGRELRLSPVDVNTLLEHVRELTRARWHDMPQERGVVISFELVRAPDLPPLMGAESEIRDALTNLVLNAVDAMPEGGTLTLRSGSRADARRVARGDTPGLGVTVEVCDSGAGMSETVRIRCLEPFFTTKGERGSGLGLAMVYGMVQRHSGELEIESVPGGGTTVRLIFPAAAAFSQPLPVDPPPATVPLRILIIDDDPLLLRSLEDSLQGDGHTVVAADGGQAGIDEFMAARRCGQGFAVVITDLGMPRVDGRAVAEAIGSESPRTPIILLTGWGQQLQSEGDVPAHVDRVLAKPPRLAELRAVLAAIAGPDIGARDARDT